jgi:hypothetical protein
MTAQTDYRELIPSMNRSAERFATMIQELTQGPLDIRGASLALNEAFNLDTAEGSQLDAIGLWVGVSRQVVVPLDIFFTLDLAGKGFDQGSWKGPFDVDSGLVLLDDETYRRIIRVVILANHWDGTLTQYQVLMQQAFPDNTFFAVDNFNMTLTIHVTGPELSAVMTAMLQSGVLYSIRPAGVGIAGYVLP